MVGEQTHHLFAAVGHRHPQAMVAQISRQHGPDLAVVVDHEDMRLPCSRHGRTIAAARRRVSMRHILQQIDTMRLSGASSDPLEPAEHHPSPGDSMSQPIFAADRLSRSSDAPTLKQSIAMAACSAAITAALMFNAPKAHAQEGAADAPDWNIVVGGGAIYAPDYEGSKDHEVMPFPFLSVDYKDIAYIRGPEIGVNVLRFKPAEDMKISVGPLARYQRNRSEKRNDALIGLGKVDMSIEVGGSARLDIGRAWLQLSVAKDVAGGHDGVVGTAASGVDFDLAEKLSLSLSGTTSWADDKYMESYFSVTQAQSALSGLPQFSAGKGLKDVGASIGLRYRLTDHWLVAATGGYTRLLNDAKDAPLVRFRGSPDQWQGGLFVAYRF
ncbi:MipA/OmpV family protein [Sphingopyxis panaciterrae]